MKELKKYMSPEEVYFNGELIDAYDVSKLKDNSFIGVKLIKVDGKSIKVAIDPRKLERVMGISADTITADAVYDVFYHKQIHVSCYHKIEGVTGYIDANGIEQPHNGTGYNVDTFSPALQDDDKIIRTMKHMKAAKDLGLDVAEVLNNIKI